MSWKDILKKDTEKFDISWFPTAAEEPEKIKGVLRESYSSPLEFINAQRKELKTYKLDERMKTGLENDLNNMQDNVESEDFNEKYVKPYNAKIIQYHRAMDQKFYGTGEAMI